MNVCSTVRAKLAVGIACVVLAGPAAMRPADAQDGVNLVPHRAVYDLRLTQSRGKQSIETVRGRILYDFTGSVCEGFSLSFRQVTELDSGEGKRTVSDLRTTHWENAAATSFRFSSQNIVDSRPEDEAEGAATRSGGRLSVTLTKPEPKRFEAEDAVFPSDHMRRIILAARAGKTILEVGTFDGGENGEKFYNSLTVIGPAIPPGERAPTDASAKHASLATLVRWPVTISYFDRSQPKADQTPAYAITFELFENGLARAIKLDYGDFVLDGELTALDLHTPKPCP